MARPTDYNEDLASDILALMVEGRSLKSICEHDAMPDASTVYRWLHKHSAFRDNYARAQQDRMTAFAEDVLEIADDNTGDTQRDKLRVDTRKWIMSKMDPKRFGEKVTQEHTGEVAVTQITRKIIDTK